MIAIRDISVAFGGVTALNHVTVDLSDLVVGIIGPNGAGKTTFLNVLSGFVVPKSGSINAFGTEVLALSPHRRSRWGLRRSFQKEQVVDELTVEDNVGAVLDNLSLGSQERERHLSAALEFTGLSAVRRAKAAGLNAFQRRMTEIARCSAGKPKVLMLDEPGAGLSQNEVEILRRTISDIHAFNGAMTLLIDHDVDLIQAVCSSTMVLDFGSLVTSGPTREVLSDPRVRAVYLGVEELA
ncbi:ATP-binding cassette domain-containing protein [Rhizobium sp. KVB221]|uniref:ATP-binding cassette domain-containing protein n=1 Tax=Rhizobium setariae TaxID=2801340 RepID=A0A936YUJ4_9HYPH|nr:ATP-binding cassette domain-containing protein [Rhizobium setariae]MBL0373227.1 ATP-binding cassette domain-containing protein [Rhizobium setariae]